MSECGVYHMEGYILVDNEEGYLNIADVKKLLVQEESGFL